MKTQRIIKSGFRTVWTHKVRSLFMVLSVMIGIAALTVVLSLGRGTEQRITGQVRKYFSSNSILIVAGGGKLEPNKPVTVSGTLKLEDVEEAVRLVPGIAAWDAVQRVPDRNAQAEGNSMPVDISGHTPAAEHVWNCALTAGRFFGEAEYRALARVAVIGPHVRDRLFGTADPTGQTIRIDNIPFQVIGVLGKRGMDPHGIDKDNEILVPLSTAMRRIVNVDFIMFAKALLEDERRMQSTAEGITRVLREKHALNAQEENDFTVVTPVRVQEIINRMSRVFNVYLPLLAAVSLLVGGLVIVNLMLLSVNERVKEIGLRMAVGARSRDIAAQFLIEAATVTLISGAAGIAAGALLFLRIAPLVNVPAGISWGAVLACSVVSIAMGIAAGYVPALKASRLSPVEALR